MARKIVGIFNRLLLGGLVIVLGITCYAKFIRKDAVIKWGQYGILIVLTNSMEPTIEQNELILIKEEETYEQSEIVTYIDERDTLITHRIVKLENESFSAKGDNNSILDEIRPVDCIQGKVMYHSKILGIFVLYYWKRVIVIYVLLMLIFYAKSKLRKEEKNEVYEK